HRRNNEKVNRIHRGLTAPSFILLRILRPVTRLPLILRGAACPENQGATPGQCPDFFLNINWGTISYRMPMIASDIDGNIKSFEKIANSSQSCIDEGKTIDEVKRVAKETGKAIDDTSKTTASVVECVGAIAGACVEPAAIPLVYFACRGAYDSVKELLEAAEKEKAEREAAAREEAAKRKEEAIDRAARCGSISAGIERARDFDGADIISRTA
uniref:hypothetical protein n=1 Tax=Caballeronia sp. AZ10_KS36 TaxID=2921757 RepID=UPI002027A12B